MTMDQMLQAYFPDFSQDTADKLKAYLQLLIEWNQKINLTSVKEEEMPERHFLDSLFPLWLENVIPQAGSLVDVGTGAGFPGLPLAISRPRLQVLLLDSQEKRCKFLLQVKETLDLPNVCIVHARAEEGGRNPLYREKFDVAVARAVAAANVLCEYLLPFVRVGGKALLWKGPNAAAELVDAKGAAGQLGGKMLGAIPMNYENEKHILLPVEKIQKTLPQFPRTNGTPSKRPLK